MSSNIKSILKKYLLYRMQTGFDAIKNQNLRSGFGGVLAHIIGMGQEAGEIRRDVPAGELSDHLDWLYALIIILWLSYPERSSVDELVDGKVDLFLNGARERPDKEN